MNFNTDGVKDCAAKLSTSLNSMRVCTESMMELNKTICRKDVWDAKSSDHYNSLYEDVINNYFILCDKYSNIMEQMIKVIDNYNNITHRFGTRSVR